MSEVHRASPRRPSPSTQKITATLAIHPKLVSRMQRNPNITNYKSNHSTSWCLFLTSQGLAWLLQWMLPCIWVLPDLSHLNHSATAPPHLLCSYTWPPTPRGCQQLHNLSYKVTLLLQKRTLQQPSVHREHAWCLRYVACQKQPSSTEANGLQSKNIFPTP